MRHLLQKPVAFIVIPLFVLIACGLLIVINHSTDPEPEVTPKTLAPLVSVTPTPTPSVVTPTPSKTTKPKSTKTVKPKPKPTQTAASRSKPTPTKSYKKPNYGRYLAVLKCIRAHESDTAGGYKAVNKSSGAAGAYQMMPQYSDDWARRFGYPEWAHLPANRWPPAVQDAVAVGLLKEQGTKPWTGTGCYL